MATKIVTKNSSTASAVPTASDLVQGELAVNVADKRLFTEDNAGAIVELGTNPSGNVTFQDNGKAIFGAGSDLQIYHDGSHSYVGDYGTGNLSVTGNNLYLQNTSGETYLSGISDGAVSLYHNNAEKLATTSTGIDVTGNVTMATGGSIVAGGANDLILNAGESGTPDIYLQSGGSTKVKIEGSNGNVGIAGQTNPTYKLDGGFADQTWGWYLNSSYNAGFTYNTTERSLLISTKSAENIDHIKFATGGAATERMRIDSSGNVGIGVSTPSNNHANANNLVVGNGTAGGIANYVGTGTGWYAFSRANANNSDAYDGGISYDGSRNLMFHTNAGTERMRIDSSGRLLVNTSSILDSSEAKLQVLQTVTSHWTTRFNNSAANPYGLAISYSTSPNGTDNHLIYIADSVAARFGVFSNGGIQNYQANDSNLSDRREKTNFAPAKSYLETICAIPVQTFNYIDQNMDDDDSPSLGVVAQDVQAVAPELITESNWGTANEPKMRLSIYQTDFQYALMKCIQEQQTLIESLTARIAALEE